jgi:hypothetical protein
MEHSSEKQSDNIELNQSNGNSKENIQKLVLFTHTTDFS